jgi:TldD protein
MNLTHFYVEDMPRRAFLHAGLKGGIALAATPSLMAGLLSAVDAGGAAPRLEPDPQMLNRVIQAALQNGGDFAEVYVENRISRDILMEESKVKQAVFGISQGAGVRVISGDKTGYAYTDEITEEKLKRAAGVASYVARGTRPAKPVDVRKAERSSFVTVKIALDSVADAKRIETMKRADQAALSYDPRIKMASISYYDEVRGRTIANSEGLLLNDELPLLFFIVQTLGVGNNTRHMGRERLSMHSGFEMFEQVTPEEVARRCARESIAMLAAEDCPAGKMDVVMQNGWGGVLVHEAIGHPLEADNIARQVGAFTDKMGQKVAKDIFTMVDDGSIPGARGTTNFDDEGTSMQRNVLIEKGVLKLFMTDILSAKQLKMKRTGNGRRESFRFPPIPRMTNTFIDKGTDKPEDILASTKRGIYVQALSGGSVNPTTGMFNFTCRECYLIEDGKKTMPVKGATLIGSCMDIISNIDAVGDDLDYGPGICGKGQNAEVNAGQPTVRIRGINVGGTRA